MKRRLFRELAIAAGGQQGAAGRSDTPARAAGTGSCEEEEVREGILQLASSLQRQGRGRCLASRRGESRPLPTTQRGWRVPGLAAGCREPALLWKVADLSGWEPVWSPFSYQLQFLGTRPWASVSVQPITGWSACSWPAGSGLDLMVPVSEEGLSETPPQRPPALTGSRPRRGSAPGPVRSWCLCQAHYSREPGGWGIPGRAVLDPTHHHGIKVSLKTLCNNSD
nr:uncharacterized protein LOC125641349 [Caretta caretta]